MLLRPGLVGGLSFLSLVNCAPAPDDAARGVTYAYVVSAVRVPEVVQATRVAGGFDLDHAVGAGSGPCEDQLDFVSPSGVLGVDNQLAGSLVPRLIEAHPDSRTPNQILSELLAHGTGLLAIEIEGVEEGRAIDDVIVQVSEAVLLGGGDGGFSAGGEIARGHRLATVSATIRDGVLDFEFDSIPVYPPAIDLYRGRMVAVVTRDSLDGEVGAEVSLREAALMAVQLSDGRLTDVASVPVEWFAADLSPDGAGACTGMSIAVEFHALATVIR
jgi:hypothetical protein